MKTLKKAILLLFLCFSIKTAPFVGKDKFNLSNIEKEKDSSKLGKELNSIHELYKNKKLDSALKRALDFSNSLKENNLELKLKTNFLIGDVFYETLNYKDGIKYFRKNINLLSKKSLDNNSSIIDDNSKDVFYIENLLRLGSSYHKLNENDSIKLYKDSTLLYYNKVISFRELNPGVLNKKAIAYSNLSALYIRDSLFENGETYIYKAIEIYKKKNDKLNQAATLGNLASIYLMQAKYEIAKTICLQGLELIKNNNSSKAIRFKASLYSNLSWAMYKMKDYKAYEFQEISFEIKDKLRDSEIRRMIKKINAEYNVNNVRKEEENKRLKEQRAFWFGGVIAILIIISLGYIIKLKDLRRKNLALSFTQKELIKNQEIEKIRSDSHIRILNATIDGKESERKQIAETLHDSVSALLSSANMHLQATRKQFNGSTPLEIDKTQKIIEEASHKVRDLSHNLVSSILLKFGLDFAIRDISEKYSNSELTIETEIRNIRRYSQNFEIKIYNIIQEFVNNILKHSKANYALIELKEDNNKLFIVISDDGVGFDKTNIKTKSGLGLNQIEARVRILKGKFNINSSKDNGTTIYVEIPVIDKEIIANHV